MLARTEPMREHRPLALYRPPAAGSCRWSGPGSPDEQRPLEPGARMSGPWSVGALLQRPARLARRGRRRLGDHRRRRQRLRDRVRAGAGSPTIRAGHSCRRARGSLSPSSSPTSPTGTSASSAWALAAEARWWPTSALTPIRPDGSSVSSGDDRARGRRQASGSSVSSSPMPLDRRSAA
jgi:hypothetical protein